jgi:hypothetical protein
MVSELNDARREEPSYVLGERDMLAEYARHNGHADLLREMVDGAVGW